MKFRILCGGVPVTIATVFLILCLVTCTDAQTVSGQIGTARVEGRFYTPTITPVPFYLNTGAPATASGFISSIRYCYSIRNRLFNSYQATVGIYSIVSPGRYELTSIFNITKQADEVEFPVINVQCDTIDIDARTVVGEGNVFGVCSTSEGNVGGLNLVADIFPAGDLEGGQEARGGVGSEELCTPQGSVPTQLRRNVLDGRTSPGTFLLLQADIELSAAPSTDAPSTDPGSVDSVTESGITNISFSEINAGDSLTTEDSNDQGAQSNTALSMEAAIGIALGVVAVIILSMCVCLVCTCWCSRKKRYSFSSKRRDVTDSTNDYFSFDDHRAQGRVQPHFIGPEHMTTSVQHTSSAQYATVKRTTGMFSNPVFVPQPRATSSTEVGVSNMDTTAVVYTQLLSATDSASAVEPALRPPALSEENIFAQLQTYGSRTLKRADIEITDTGGGLKRVVWKNKEKLVEIHLRKGKETPEDKVGLLQEAAILSQFKHPNIIGYYGILVDGLQVTIVEEMLCGSLKSFLLRLQQAASGKSSGSMFRVTPKMLLNFSQQVALGLKYLAAKGLVHGRVMASSVLLSSSNVCKITDFSWSKDIANNNVQSLKVSTRWSAPEVVTKRSFTTASDVWSYGCLLYEIWSLGKDPYEGRNLKNVFELLKLGWRMAPPPGCPKIIYELMMESWSPEAKDRPSFEELVRDLMRVEALVLNIPQQLQDQHPQCAKLGGPLNAGKVMYKDIQTMYSKRTLTRGEQN